jgi:cobalt-zinc-cadmium resistance protein CzcA
VARYLEKRLKAFPEVETVVSKTGRAEISEDPMGPEQTDVFVMLKPRRAWSRQRPRAELAEAMQRELSQVPGLRFSFSQPIALRVNELISGVKSDLAVKVFGADLAQLKGFADRIAVAVGGVRGAADVKVEQVSGLDQFDVVIDREAAARHGITVSDINDTIEAAIAGKAATTLIEEQRRFAVVVRYPPESRADLQRIRQLLVVAPGGERVPLGQLAEVRLVEAPAQVSRENGTRRVVVEANVRGRDLGGFVAEVRERLAPVARELPSGAWLELGGQFENQQRAMRQLAVVVPVALALILLLLYLALGSFRDALLVLLNLPFALVGGVVAVVLFRMPLSVSAAVAFVVLLGVAVQNGVVLVAFLRQLRDRGRTVTEAVREGCDLRFRPLLMTALTSFIGHLPMLYAQGSGADIQRPLAVVVMGGLVTSTALTLLVLPALYVALAGAGDPVADRPSAGDSREPPGA